MLSDQVASGDHEELAHSVLVVGGAVCEVVEAAAQVCVCVCVCVCVHACKLHILHPKLQ